MAAVWKHGQGNTNDDLLWFASLFGAPTALDLDRKEAQRKWPSLKTKARLHAKISLNPWILTPALVIASRHPIMSSKRNLSRKEERKERKEGANKNATLPIPCQFVISFSRWHQIFV
jgi:hypothetical protein